MTLSWSPRRPCSSPSSSFDIVAFDVVEVAPNLDPSEVTAAAAAKLVREGILLFGGRRERERE